MSVSPSSKSSLWQFIDDQGSFQVPSPLKTGRLYFPLANEAGMLSSITPELRGDLKTGHNSFLTPPLTIEDLRENRFSRNFWVHVEGRGTWSAAGVSSWQEADKANGAHETLSVQAGFLWHKTFRENRELGLKAEIVNFVPVSSTDPVEIMLVTVVNSGKTRIKLTVTSAVPIFARSADNARDHYHVTSLLNRVLPHPSGVVIRPTMSFDERGHKINELLYAVLGASGDGEAPAGRFSAMPHFVGEGGHFERPRAVIENWPAPRAGEEKNVDGKSAIGALRFRALSLGAGGKAAFVLVMGIAKKEAELDEWLRKYGSAAKAEASLKATKEFWAAKADAISLKTPDKTYNGWFRWVSVQPTFRKLFGCSFLPDFDYGRGGRGWRDLWQDCLGLLLTSADEAKGLLAQNFDGIRIDGSNATIIGKTPGEFVADRNNITRVWMDHGVWPFLTLELYVNQTGDFSILSHEAGYFRDRQMWRARKKDTEWTEGAGNRLTDRRGRLVQGSVLEHLLVQHLVQFFNVGDHNHIRLENADWNDGLDMAYEKGESVAFTCLYASNLSRLAALIEEAASRLGWKKITLFRELLLLLDRAAANKVDYEDAAARRRRLDRFFESVQPEISGVKAEIPVAKLCADLREKADFLSRHVRRKEWMQSQTGQGFYNGYYDNHGRRVESDASGSMHLTLAGQTFPILSGVADAKQVPEIFSTVRAYLKDREHGGFRLNTDFGGIRPDLGRAFSFAYGEKENGAFFSHMTVMFAFGLYSRGFVAEGFEVLDSIYRMCVRTEKSRIYPGVPEYFNSEGRGHYHYLTGSASWLTLTVLTQVYGVRGLLGDLLLSPKLTQQDFRGGFELSIRAEFAGRPLRVTYRNAKKIPYEHYCITKVSINGKELKGLELNRKETCVPRELFLKSTKKGPNDVLVILE